MGGIPWSEKERDLLRKNYQKIGPTECHALLPDRSADTIQCQARALGLTAEGRRCGQNKKPNSWTKEELQIIRDNYASIGPEGCQKLLQHRSILSICERARPLKLTVLWKRWFKGEDAWTEEEISILKNSYLQVSPKKLIGLLPGRTSNAIHTRAGILKITDPTRKRRWSPNVKAPEPDPEASKKYGRPVYRVYLVGNERFSLVEKRDLSKVLQYRWYEFKSKNTFYASTPIKKKTTLMHRLITGVDDDREVDHWNGNGLDNVGENLRKCTRAQNTWNRSITKSKRSSSYKGVFRRLSRTCEKPWIARIAANGKKIHLGYYPTAEEAALVVNKALLKYHGKFARLNRV